VNHSVQIIILDAQLKVEGDVLKKLHVQLLNLKLLVQLTYMETPVNGINKFVEIRHAKIMKD
jgi:hypothetical protein